MFDRDEYVAPVHPPDDTVAIQLPPAAPLREVVWQKLQIGAGESGMRGS